MTKDNGREFILDEVLGDSQVRFKIAKDSPWDLELHLYSDYFNSRVNIYSFGASSLREFAEKILEACPEIDETIAELDAANYHRDLERRRTLLEEECQQADAKAEKIKQDRLKELAGSGRTP